MAATARKLPAVDDRAELAAALEAAAEAREALNRHKQAIDRTRSSVRAAEKAVEVARKGVTKAQEEYGLALADAAVADDDVLPPTNLARLASAGLEDAESELVALRSAGEKLRRDAPAWERHAAEVDAEVEAAISAILAPHAQRLLDRLRELIAEAQPYRSLLAGLLDSHADRIVDHTGRRPIEPQLDAARKLTWVYSLDDMPVSGASWTAARAALRADPCAVLPDFVAAPAPPDAA